MKNIDLLPEAQALKDQIRLSRDKLHAAAGIQVDIIGLANDILRVSVEQATLINNYILNQAQLVGRAGALLCRAKSLTASTAADLAVCAAPASV